MRLRRFACAAVLVASVFSSTSALAAETAEYCSETDMTCETAPIAFSKEIVLPVQGGFDTGWVPQGSPLQVHLWAQLWANSYVDLAGRLETTWPDALTLDAIPDPGGVELGIHYGVDIGAQAHVEVTVLGQTFDWTGDIPYVPQFDFQVEASNTFDPWGFEGISVEGSTMEATIAQISATDFIGVNIPGLDGGFELNTYIELTATYRTTKIDVVRMPNEDAVTGGAIDAEGETTSDDYAGEHGIDYGVRPVGEVIYDGVLHLIPAFYIETIGPDFSIPIADIPIPFEFIQKDWEFDFAEVHVPLPDVELNQEGEGADVEAALVLDLGELEVGESASGNVAIGNVGEAALAGVATLASDSGSTAGFSLSAPTFSVGQGGEAPLAITFDATAPGTFTATVILASNDPDEPSRTLEVRALVLEPEDLDDDDGDDGVDPLDDVSARGGGCACELGAAHGPSRSAGWATLGLAVVVAAATRRRRAR